MRRLQLSIHGWKPCLALLLLAVIIVGCQGIHSDLGTMFGDQAAQPTPPAPNKTIDGPKFQFEVRETGKQPQLKQLPLPEVLYVQQLLDETGTSRRIKRMKIEIYRQLPNGGGHRLDVAFDRATHKVPPGADYAIHANDRVVVTEDTSTLVDDMLNSIGIPLPGNHK